MNGDIPMGLIKNTVKLNCEKKNTVKINTVKFTR